MALGLNNVNAIVVWFVPSCNLGLASSTYLHGVDGLGIHPYGHPLQLHGKLDRQYVANEDSFKMKAHKIRHEREKR